MPKFGLYVVALVGALSLVACTSNSGSSSSNPTISTVSDTQLLGEVSGAQLPSGSGIGTGTATNTRASVTDTEYSRNSVFDSVRLYAALQWNITGNGTKIAILDTGIDADHVDIASNLDTANSGNSINSTTFGSGYQDTDGHGTNSAGIALANNNGTGVQGVAPDATLIAIKVTNAGNLTEANQIRGMDMARTAGADIVNLSFGLSGFENQNLEQAIASGAMTQSLIDAYKRGVADDIIYTLAAGNSGNANPEWDGKFAAYGAAGGHALVVGSLNAAGDDIASFSNRAGDAKNYYILAPGEDLLLPNSDGTLVTTSGTSFAAPFVAGAAALIKSSGPPTLSGKDVVEILLSTTDDLGAAGVDAIYGAGRLNIERALSPVGSPTVSSTSSVDGRGVALSELQVTSAGLVGNNIKQASALKNVLFFDKYKRAYTSDVTVSADLQAAGETPASTTWLNAATYSNQQNLGADSKLSISYDLQDTADSVNAAQLNFTSNISDKTTSQLIVGNKWASGFKQAGFDGFEDASKTSFYSLSDQGVGTSVASNVTDKTTLKFNAGIGQNADSEFDGRQQLAVAGVSHTFAGKSVLSVDLGVSRENNQLMGTELGAGFNSVGDVDTKFVSLGLQHKVMPNLDLGLNYSFGETAGFEGQNLVTSFSGGKLDSAEVWLAYQGKQQSLKAGLSRELGYRSGNLALSVPTSITYEGDVGTVHFDEQNIDLKSATTYGAALSYSRNLGRYGSLEVMGKVKAAHTGNGSTGFEGSSVDTGVKYKLKF